jgi:integrase
LTCHSFRHGKAHEMMRMGAGVKEIASVLGHSETNPRAAFQYLRLNEEESLAVAKRYVP